MSLPELEGQLQYSTISEDSSPSSTVLPPEIVLSILDCACPSVLREAAATSSLLYSHSLKRLYHTIVIQDYPSKFLTTYPSLPKAKQGIIGSTIRSLVLTWTLDSISSTEQNASTHPVQSQPLRQFLSDCKQLEHLVLILMQPIYIIYCNHAQSIFPSGFNFSSLRRVVLGACSPDRDLRPLLEHADNLQSLDISSAPVLSSYPVLDEVWAPQSIGSLVELCINLGTVGSLLDGSELDFIAQFSSLRILSIDSDIRSIDRLVQSVSRIDLEFREQIEQLCLTSCCRTYDAFKIVRAFQNLTEVTFCFDKAPTAQSLQLPPGFSLPPTLRQVTLYYAIYPMIHTGVESFDMKTYLKGFRLVEAEYKKSFWELRNELLVGHYEPIPSFVYSWYPFYLVDCLRFERILDC